MKLIHCDNPRCEITVDEREFERNMKWITAQRGGGHGNPHVNGPWQLCSWLCAEQFFAAKKGTR